MTRSCQASVHACYMPADPPCLAGADCQHPQLHDGAPRAPALLHRDGGSLLTLKSLAQHGDASTNQMHLSSLAGYRPDLGLDVQAHWAGQKLQMHLALHCCQAAL